MAPFGRLQALRARDNRIPPISINIPVVGLALAFAVLILVCIGSCCGSPRKTAKQNERSKQRRCRSERNWVGSTRGNSSLMNDLSSERRDAAKPKAANWSGVSEPPAYSTINPATLEHPQIPPSESERLLPPTPTITRAPSPPPPTYSAVR